MDSVLFRDHELRRQFVEQGFVVIPFLSEAEIIQLRQVFDELHPHRLSAFHSTVTHKSEKHRRAVHEAIAAAYARKMETELSGFKICIANFVVKEPGEDMSRVPMHVDWSFVDESRFSSLNIWCPITDVDTTNGCLEVVPGSHYHDALLRPHAENQPGSHPYHNVLELLKTFTRKLPMSAGEAVVYSGRLLHGSGPNTSNQRRIAVGCAIAPREAPLLHSIVVSPTQAEIFEVSEEFFWTYQLGSRPANVKSLGVVKHHVKQLTEQDILNSTHLHPVIRA